MKHNQMATTRQQSKRLLELGANTSTADMHYWLNHEDKWDLRIGNGAEYQVNRNRLVEAWSLSALLAILPRTIKAIYTWDLNCFKDFYMLEYGSLMPLEYGSLIQLASVDLFDVVMQMIEWLVDNGYVLNQNNE
jgi:hypothetical protein